jgi:2-octaprenyl-6-methoxyphenol hydroxylase
MRLGRFIDAGPRAQFPLQLRFRRDPVAGRRSLAIGNAAQSLHPVAGQGLNLGLRDVSDLVDLIQRTSPDKLGTGEFLAAYRRMRRADRAAMIGATDSFVRLFSNNDPLLRHARGIALSALDCLPPARRFFARRMIYGLRAMP